MLFINNIFSFFNFKFSSFEYDKNNSSNVFVSDIYTNYNALPILFRDGTCCSGKRPSASARESSAGRVRPYGSEDGSEAAC